MKIDVVVPVYNEEKNIERCLDSLLKQDVAANKIIVVNDCSIDKTAEKLRKYKKGKGFEIIDKKKNQGRPKAVNEGINKSKADVIAVTDGDCIIPKNWIKKVQDNFKDKELSAVGGVFEPINKKKPIAVGGYLIEQIFRVLGLFPNQLSGANSAYRRDVLKEVGGYPNKRWGADPYLALELIEKNKKIKTDNKLIIKTEYPDTWRSVLRRKFYWGGGAAKLLNKMKYRPLFIARPLYFLLLLLSFILYFFGFQSSLWLFAMLLFAGTVLPFVFCTIYAIKNKWGLPGAATTIALLLIQEISYTMGFVYVLLGGRLGKHKI